MNDTGPLELGSRFLKYQVKGLLGRGGHACVYHGFDAFMGRDVAIKILHRFGGVSRDFLRRGQLEAMLLSRLRHPNIVEVIDAGITEQGLLYIVMERLEGRSLDALLSAEKKLGLREALSLFASIADALQVAHEAGAIHRDLKPANVFVVRGNRPKVLDFGIAKLVDSAWTTQEDMVLGTVFYMSPEQLQARRLTHHTDIYSLGVMLDEALSGEHYLRRTAREKGLPLELISHVIPLVVEEPIRALHEVDPALPPYVGELVARCMSKSPAQRFDSMKELAAALRHSLERHLDDDRSRYRSGASPRDLSLTPSTPPQAPPAAARLNVEADTEVISKPSFFDPAWLPAPSKLETNGPLPQLNTEPLAPVRPPSSANFPVAPPPSTPLIASVSPAVNGRLKTLPLGSGSLSPKSGAPILAVAPANQRDAPTEPPILAVAPANQRAENQANLVPPPRATARPLSRLKRALLLAGLAGSAVFGGSTYLALRFARATESRAPSPPPAVVVERVFPSSSSHAASALPLSANEPQAPAAQEPEHP